MTAFRITKHFIVMGYPRLGGFFKTLPVGDSCFYILDLKTQDLYNKF